MIASAQANKNPVSANVNASASEQPEIDSQETYVEELRDKNKWPGRFNIALLAVAGIIAVLIALNSQWLRRSTARLSSEEHTLTELKVAKVKADAERKIETDTERVRLAAANDLQVKTDAVREESKTEQKRIEAEANRKIEEARNDANVKIAEAGRQTEELRKDNLVTEARLGAEKDSRIKLLQTLAARTIRETADNASVFRNLDLSTGTEVDFKFLADDAEVRRAARQIAKTVEEFGWRVASFNAVLDLEEESSPWKEFEGVLVKPQRAPGEYAPENRATKDKGTRAAMTLAQLLQSQGWKADFHFSSRPDGILGHVTVIVGLKPSPIEPERIIAPSEPRRILETRVPRVLGNTEGFVQTAKQFAGMNLVVTYSNQSDEAKNLAEQISSLLIDAGFHLDRLFPDDDPTTLREDVIIDCEPERQGNIAKLNLVIAMEDRGVDARPEPGGGRQPPNTIKIRVGVRPLTELLPPDELKKSLEFKKQQRERYKKQLEAIMKWR